MDIEKAKGNEEPFTFRQLDQIIQERTISEDIAHVLAFGFGLDNCVRHAISRLRLVAESAAPNRSIRDNFKKITNIDIPDLSIVTAADLRTGKYCYYTSSQEGNRPILSSTSLSEMFESA